MLPNAGVQRDHVVVFVHFDALLHENRAGIHLIGHQMHGAAGDFDSVLQGLGHRLHGAAESRQQRRMGIEDSAAICCDELPTEDFVKARENDEADAGRLKGFEEKPLAVGATGHGRAIYHADPDTGGRRAADRGRFGPIAAYQDNACWEVCLVRGVEQRLQVGAAPGDEDTDSQGRKITR